MDPPHSHPAAALRSRCSFARFPRMVRQGCPTSTWQVGQALGQRSILRSQIP